MGRNAGVGRGGELGWGGEEPKRMEGDLGREHQGGTEGTLQGGYRCPFLLCSAAS